MFDPGTNDSVQTNMESFGSSFGCLNTWYEKNNHQYIYIYKQRPHTGVYEVIPSGALILHLAFFLPLSLNFFYCYPKVHIN